MSNHIAIAHAHAMIAFWQAGPRTRAAALGGLGMPAPMIAQLESTLPTCGNVAGLESALSDSPTLRTFVMGAGAEIALDNPIGDSVGIIADLMTLPG